MADGLLSAHTGPVTGISLCHGGSWRALIPIRECHPSLSRDMVSEHYLITSSDHRGNYHQPKGSLIKQWQWWVYYGLHKHCLMIIMVAGFPSKPGGIDERGKSPPCVLESSQGMGMMTPPRLADMAPGPGPLSLPGPSHQPSAVMLSIINTGNNCATITMLTQLIFFLFLCIVTLCVAAFY